MKHIPAILSTLLIFVCISTNAQKSDFREYTDIVSYNINLNITDFKNKSISGFTELDLIMKENPDKKITLDFEALIVDSVFLLNKKITTFSYDKRYLSIPYPIADGKNINLKIYYHGKPIEDESWGGFFFTDSIAFNMGVGMSAEVKGFGRIWYPCNDGFTDKALYTYNITVPKGFKAVCSGMLTDSTLNSDKTETYTWKLNNPIPTYISSVAVGNYHVIKRIYKGIKRDIPVEIYVTPTYLKEAVRSFRNLTKTIAGFENSYGEYVWQRVGYVGVPFNSGAMEHSCNIAYPEYAIDGSKDRETLYAHELSHSWFGNLVTCKTAKDMWLNEGWASYSEALFKELIYGQEEYADYVKNNHTKVLTYTHIADGGYFPVYGIPNQNTYGSTVYDKGADVAYTLRGYLGDELFFGTLKSYFVDNAYKAVSTEEFKQYFSTKTGIDLTDFFNTWVYTAGFPHYAIKAFSITKKASVYQTRVVVKQSLRERSFYGLNNKIDIMLIGADLSTKIFTNMFSGSEDSKTFETNFKPQAVIIDPYQKLADTKVSSFKFIKTLGETNYDYSNFAVTANKLKDSVAIYCASNYIAPDNITENSNKVSKYMYWTIAGVADKTVNELEFNFYVNTYDYKLFQPFSKVVLLYRSNSSEVFTKVNCDKKTINEYEGIYTVKDYMFGEYALGVEK
jgi:aminopeptidase N